MHDLTITTNAAPAHYGIGPLWRDEFLASLEVTPASASTYRRALKQFLRYLYICDIRQPRREDVMAYRDDLRRRVKPATVQGYITVVKLFFIWLELKGYYPDIAKKIKGAKLTREHKKDYLTARQAKAVLDGFATDTEQGARNYAIFRLMLTAGLRTIEVARADIGDMRPAGGEMVLYIQGKGRTEKGELVVLESATETALRAYLALRESRDENEPLFASVSNHNRGRRMTTRSVSRIAKQALVRAGLNSARLTAHSLRHTTATLNLLAGATAEETQQLLRHASIDTTMIYSHHIDRLQNKSAARVGAAIDEA